MASTESLDLLDQRISKLENSVFGNAEKDADYPKNKDSNIQCIESLLGIQSKMSKALGGKSKATMLYNRLPELNKYLDYAQTDELMLSDDAKGEVILAETDFLEQQASLFHKMSEKQDHINSEHIQAVPKFSDQLQTLSQVQINQQDEVAVLTEESRRMLEAYNKVINILSKQFVLWDQTLSQLEAKKAKK